MCVGTSTNDCSLAMCSDGYSTYLNGACTKIDCSSIDLGNVFSVVDGSCTTYVSSFSSSSIFSFLSTNSPSPWRYPTLIILHTRYDVEPNKYKFLKSHVL